MSKRSYRNPVLLVITSLLFVLLQACSNEQKLDGEFKSRLDALDSNSVRFRNADKEIAYLSARISAEKDRNRRSALFAAYSNSVINVPIVSTNNLTRERYARRGTIIGPYKYTVRSYREFVHAAFDKVGGEGTFNHFCLDLEIWKRLDRELVQSNMLMEMIARASVEYGQEALAEDYKRDAVSTLVEAKREIEQHLEDCYRTESDESRRAYALFREVIDREADPPYRKHARKIEAIRRKRNVPAVNSTIH